MATARAAPARLQGAYLSGAALLKLACAMRGYYWERQRQVFAIDQAYAIFDGNGIHVASADSPAGCRRAIVDDFKGYIDELVRGV